MNKTLRTSVIALAGASLVSVATPFLASATTARASATTYLYNCSTRTQRPHEIVLTCADANTYVTDITWSHWTSANAHAQGVLHWNTCTPTCVAGTNTSRAITFIATHRRKVKGVWLYSALSSARTTWHTGSAIFTLPTAPL